MARRPRGQRAAPGTGGKRRSSGQGDAHETMMRVVAVGNRISLRAACSEATFATELERIVGLAAPHLTRKGPNLLVLTEVLGLPAALTGPRAWPARHARTAQTALTLLALAYLPRVLAARRRWKGVSLPRALLLARADALYRPFAETLARLAARHRTHIVATTLAPRVRHSRRLGDVLRWGRLGAGGVYVPRGPQVYNAALVFGPDGALLGRVDKVFLTSSEKETLDLSPGRLEDVRVLHTGTGRLGVAISLDAFTSEFCRQLDAQGAEIVVQPDANDRSWAGPGERHAWQPAEWLGSVLGSIQPEYASLRYNVCAMQTGNFFDLVFDGQSSITAGANTPPDARDRERSFVGVDEFVHTDTGARLLGELVAVAPWVAPDPVLAEPSLGLEERRARLEAVGRDLLPGGKRANQYRESVIWADLPVRSAKSTGR
jgi:predicted amidohydrolase